ncbi:V-type ATP synthase subunit E [Anaeromicropila populeti]|uniref:H+-ATPase subunit E/Vma4 n=1 Tax=Anaeromicropila populeti TaxID=37658 RepID=A0A1I6LB26_9FIRM|nr:V-type ATP synthase subunit E [Anaeromicropila populeti]SFS00624.1 H+-ATPase subunit E/Vma4 [Anaeromicropila populeti]
MTLNEKLDIFYNAAISDATTQSIELLKEYENNLRESAKIQKEKSQQAAEQLLQIEKDSIMKEKNKIISDTTLSLKRTLAEKNKEYEQIIYNKVLSKLLTYMKTNDYLTLLEKQINFAKNFILGAEVTIYLSSSDFNKKEFLEEKTGISLELSKDDFTGGIRAIIHTKNILIDYSFATKLAEELEKFSF